MTLMVLGVGFFVPFVAIKTVLAQLMLRFERDDAFWVALAGHCASLVVGAPFLTLLWGALRQVSVFEIPVQAPLSAPVVAFFYGCFVIPFDVWTAQSIIRGGSYPDLDDNHPANTITQRANLTTLKLVGMWSLIANILCIGVGVFSLWSLGVLG